MLRNPIRPVTIACVCGPLGDEEAFLRLANEAAGQRPDLVVLPEVWQGWEDGPDRDGATNELRALAKRCGVYIIHPTIREEGGVKYNTALVIGRDGEFVGHYDKRYPYWGEIGQVAPGGAARVIELDFGKVGIAICFDANFPGVWAEAARQGAELMIWPSAYGAGMQLAAHALNHHYPIVTATLSGHSMAFDLDGQRTVNVRSDAHFIQWHALDLDRAIFHENFNEEKLKALLKEKPPRVEVEKRRTDEQWIIVRSAMAGQSAREVCRAAGMEELRQYKLRSQMEIDAMRK